MLLTSVKELYKSRLSEMAQSLNDKINAQEKSVRGFFDEYGYDLGQGNWVGNEVVYPVSIPNMPEIQSLKAVNLNDKGIPEYWVFNHSKSKFRHWKNFAYYFDALSETGDPYSYIEKPR
jgi:hypothetical protein